MSARVICFVTLGIALPGCLHIFRFEDAAEWQTIERIPAGRMPVASLAYSSGGSRLVSTHTSLWQHGMRSSTFPPDGVMRIWQCPDEGMFGFHELLAARSMPRLRIEPVQFEHGASIGRVVVIWGERPTIVTCDTESLEWSIRQSEVDIAAVSGDGRYLADLRSVDPSGDRNAVRLTDSESGSVQDVSVDGVLGWPWQFVFSGFFCIEDRRDQNSHWLRAWDAESGDARDPVRLNEKPFYMAVSSSTLHAVTAGLESSTFEIISFGRTNPVHEYSVESGTIHGLAVSPGDDLVAVCGEDMADEESVGFVELWDMTAGTRLLRKTEDSSWGITAVAFSPNGKRLAAGTARGEILFFDTESNGSQRD